MANRCSIAAEQVLQEIEDRLGALAEVAPAELTEGEVLEVVRRTQRIRTMVDAQCARAAAALEASKAWVGDGARSAAAWLGWRCGVSGDRARACLKTSRALRVLPRAEAAFVAGSLTADHIRLLAVAQRRNPEAFAAGGEALLVDTARAVLFSQFERAVRYWMRLAAPDDDERAARRRWEGRHLHVSSTFEGNVAIDGVLDPITGAIVSRELERLERQLFDADLAEARERHGASAPLSSLARTPSQRRADALRLMAERSAAKPADALEPIVLVQVLSGHDSVERLCELSDGTVVTPGEVLSIIDRAHLQRVVYDSKGIPIDIGPRRRLFTGTTRTAVQLRDRGCVHPSCDVPFERCEVDHVVPFAAGGPTIRDNGRCLCKYHHRRAPRGPRAP